MNGIHHPLLIDFPTLKPTDASNVQSLKEVSNDLLRVIEEQTVEAVITFESDFPSLPTLAGLLLSYPALYYSEDPIAKLLDAEVDVYSIYADSAQRQTILQFSGPAHFRDAIQEALEKLAEDGNQRLSRLSPTLSKRWTEYIGAESSCTLKTHVETRRISILTL